MLMMPVPGPPFTNHWPKPALPPTVHIKVRIKKKGSKMYTSHRGKPEGQNFVMENAQVRFVLIGLPLPLSEPQGSFSDLHDENLVGILEEKPMKGLRPL